MRYKKIDPILFRKNRKKVIKNLRPDSVVIAQSNDQMHRTGDQTFVFRQNSDLFYLTGIDQEKTILLLAPDHPDPSKKEILFIIRPNELLTIWEGQKLSIEKAKELSGIKTVMYLDSFESILRTILLDSEFIYLNVNEYAKFTSEVRDKSRRFIDYVKEAYPLHKLERLAPILTRSRFIKEKEEVAILEESCNITGKAFERVLKFVKPDVMEYEIEAEVTHEFIRRGANGHGYDPIVASGKNACTLHYIENSQRCKDGDLILFDFGAEYANYSADLSRTIPVNGRFTKRQRQAYDACLRVMKQAIDMLRPGINYGIYNKEVGKLWEEEHIKLGLYSRSDIEKSSAPLYFKFQPHNVSHPIGLDVHDVGYNMYKNLEEGMVVTCEPGIYIPDENIGIRLENDILITNGTPVDLMSHIPIEPDEIEEIMNS